MHKNDCPAKIVKNTRFSIKDKRENWIRYDFCLASKVFSNCYFFFLKKIGVTLSRETDGVWLYNRSSSPVFVHSPTLCDMESRVTIPFKIPPGHCIRAFDPLK